MWTYGEEKGIAMAWVDVITWITNLSVIFGVVVAYGAFRDDRRDRLERDRHRRTALDNALLHELRQVEESARVDLARFRPTGMDAAPPYDPDRHPAVAQARADWQTQGEIGYHRSIAWTPLLTGAISQAIREASFLKLSSEQIRDLSGLSAAILRANARIASKNALLPAVVQGRRPLHITLTYAPDEWAAMVADQLNNSIESDLREIGNLCSKIHPSHVEQATYRTGSQ